LQVIASGASGASLAANVAVAHPMVISRMISAWPPFALIVAYEMLMRQIRHSVAGRQQIYTANATPVPDQHGDLPAPDGGAGPAAGVAPTARQFPLPRAARRGMVPGGFSGKHGNGPSPTGSRRESCRPATTVTLEDDLDGGPAEETVQFGLGPVDYEIDLSAAPEPTARRTARWQDQKRSRRSRQLPRLRSTQRSCQGYDWRLSGACACLGGGPAEPAACCDVALVCCLSNWAALPCATSRADRPVSFR
jgi:hypothetical protein